MMRFRMMVFLPAISVAFLGCVNVEPPAQDRAPTVAVPVAEPPEPNEVSIQGPPAVAAEPAEATPVDTAQIDADPGPAEANEPPAPRQDTSFYGQYAEILATYVRENGLVDYGELRRRRLGLKAVLTTLDELDPNVYQGFSKPQKLAFWIDAYNLKMLEIIARNYPIESSWWLRLTWPPSDIRHIKGIWADYRFLVMDEEFTLAEVEQRFFRQTFDDPRVWLALTYACQSSPPLRTQPYGGEGSEKAGSGLYSSTKSLGSISLKNGESQSPDARPRFEREKSKREIFPSQSRPDPAFSDPSDGARATDHGPRLDRQLDRQVRRFLAGPKGLQIDRRNGVVRLSALFKPNWRGKEFIARYGTDKKFKAYDPATRAVLNFLTNYLSAEDVDFLEVENYSLQYLNFDWRLNDTDKGY